MAVTKIKTIKSTLKKALEYIQNPYKTDDKMLVSSFGCSYETADIEFAFTLSQALDKAKSIPYFFTVASKALIFFIRDFDIGNTGILFHKLL